MRASPIAVLATVALSLAGCTSHAAVVAGHSTAGGSASPDPGPVLSTPDQVPSSSEPSPTATATSSTRPAAPSFDYAAVERQLTALNYYGGAVDGQPGPALSSAVMAFQKVQGIAADGSIGAATLASLKAPRPAVLRSSSAGDRVEVDLTRQVLYVVKHGQIARIMPVSSGNGASYQLDSSQRATALTPVGWYTIQRRIIGPHVAPLGTLYDPEFFYQGWAIHGSDSVPAYPASHGCIRVSRADGKYLLGAISLGTSVYVYGGRYTFPAGSSAPGTSTPAGDGGAAAAGPAAPSPSPSPRPTASAARGSHADPSASPHPSGAPSH